MSVTPRISLVAFEDRVGGFVFVAVPDERGRYLRTDKSVVQVACPNCRSVVGEPCKLGHGYGGGTHANRRSAAKAKHYGERGQDQLDPIGVEALGFADVPASPPGLALLNEPRAIA
jgi:hypothetical protein